MMTPLQQTRPQKPSRESATVPCGASRRETILIVEDERLLRWSLREQLSDAGFQVLEADSCKAARECLATRQPDVVLLDCGLPDGDGLAVMRETLASRPGTAFLVMTAKASVPHAVEALRNGAEHYLCKPFPIETLIVTLERILESTQLRRELARAREELQRSSSLEGMVARSTAMKRVCETALRVSGVPDTTVLITGESGVGKDLLARAIHVSGPRANQPFMNVTCTAIAANLLESELFGHEAGAFTDARSRRRGLLEEARGGTVFLDEIGDLPLELQAKLLRVLQDKTFRRLGGDTELTVDVRIVAATNQDLATAVSEGRFREDLFHRLNVYPIVIPPLRERVADIQPLAELFIERENRRLGRSVAGLTPPALSKLESWHWPGNVRELRNLIERAMILGEDCQIGPDDLPIENRSNGQGARGFVLPAGGVNLEDLECDLVEQALRRSRGIKTRAGRLLGLNRDQVRYRMAKFGLEELRKA